MRLLPPEIRRRAERNDGVVTVQQLRRAGVDRHLAVRAAEAGLWQRLHRGVYVVHSGPVSWRARARAGVAYAGPGAALSRESAGYVRGLLRQVPAVVHVDLPANRRVAPSAGLELRRRRTMPTISVGLPVVNGADTVLDLVGVARGDDAVVALLCAAARVHIPNWQIVQALGARSRLPRRALVLEVLADVVDGVESPLERRYRVQVERAHGLPRARLQRRDRVGGRSIRSDAEYEGLGVRIELDGRLTHLDSAEADLWRDNAVLLERGQITLRYRWRHVVGASCGTAGQVAVALQNGGWPGRPRPCGECCGLR